MDPLRPAFSCFVHARSFGLVSLSTFDSPSRSVSGGGRGTALSELLVEEEGQRAYDPKARTTGLVEGYFGDGSNEKGEAGNV